MIKPFLTLAFSSILTLSFAQGIQFVGEGMKWQDILNKAKAENKIVFVDAFTTWCGPCKKMAKDIFPNEKVGEVFNAKFVNAKIDMEKGEGLEIAKKYNVRAYPTYIFVNGDGELVHRSLGMMPAEKFIEVAQTASDPNKQFYTLKKKYEAGEKSPEFLKSFSKAAMDAQEEELASKVASSYMATQKDWLTADNKAYILQYATSIESPLYAFLLKNKAEFTKSLPKEEVEGTIENVAMGSIADYAFDRSTRAFNKEKATEYASKYLPKETVDKSISFLLLRQSMMRNDVPNMLNQASDYFEKYPTDNVNLLNQFAWTFYEKSDDKSQLEKALKWSLRSIEIQDIYAFNDTAAALYFKLGNKQKAKEFAEKAIKQGKSSGEDVQETETLLKKIESMK